MRSGLGALEGVGFEALFSLVEGRAPTLKGIIDFELYTSFSVGHIIMSVCIILQDLVKLHFLVQSLDQVLEY